MARGRAREKRDLSMSDHDPDPWTLEVCPLPIQLDPRSLAEAPSPCFSAPPQRIQPLKIRSQRYSIHSAIAPTHRPPPGSPVLYTPLSLHLPDVVRGLRDRQRSYTDQVLWWPCPATTPSPLIPAAKQRAALATGEPIPLPELQQALSNALSDSITIQHDTPIKTSESHPIKSVDPPHATRRSHPSSISQIIPPESIVAISAHLTPCKQPCPVLFEIHLPYSLDYIAGYPQLSPSPVSSVQPNQRRPSVSGVLNALNTRISLPPLPVPSSRLLLSLKRNLKINDGSSQTDVAPPPPASVLPTTYALHPFSNHM